MIKASLIKYFITVIIIGYIGYIQNNERLIAQESNATKSCDKIENLFLAKNYNAVLQEIDLFTKSNNIFKEDGKILIQYVALCTYCYIMFDRSNDACLFMRKITESPSINTKDIGTKAILFYIRCVMECLDDNYGEALVSLNKFIDYVKDEKEPGGIFLGCQFRACLYALKGMKKEAADDIKKIEDLRKNFPHYKDVFILYPSEYMVKKFLEDTSGKGIIYRQHNTLPQIPTDGLPKDLTFIIVWGCNLINTKEEKEKMEYLFQNFDSY
jgi:hypothetical protein